jgi:immune inhibitor A
VRARKGLLAVLSAVFVVVSLLVLASSGGRAGEAGTTGKAAKKAADHAYLQKTSDRDYYLNLAAPRVELSARGTERVSGATSRSRARSSNLARWWAENSAKYSGGFPRAEQQLARAERRALKGLRNPRSFQRAQAQQTARLLTLVVEFNPDANDDFSGWERPTFEGDPECVVEPAGTTFSGPLHNQLPDPASYGPGVDNNTFWVPDFDERHYETLLYSRRGLTQRVRPDLTGPDGQPGVNLRGLTVRNMYEEMSKGRYSIAGDAVAWLMLPHSEAWYAADSCEAGIASDIGHPDNPRGVTQMVVDAVDALAAQDPSFPWADFDVEDQGDLDGDGNLREPDGVIDHFVLVHAGADEADEGGAQGTYAVWSHASVVDASTGGYTVPGTEIKAFNYIVQAEDAGVGVFAHEFGHDLGLPDLYDTSGAADSDVEFWDLMSTGSHSGPLFQTLPAHMGIWDKWVLGWADPRVIELGQRRAVRLGQASRPPRGTRDGIRVDLPDKVITLGEPLSGSNMWYSNNDQDWADVKLERELVLPAGADLRFWLNNNYVIEEFWDYGFVEVSTDGGATWAQLEVFDENGTMVSTDEDPNGRLQDYGGLENGLTGNSNGWRLDYVDLTPYAGQTIRLRLRYATDAAFLERGWFVDDMSVTVDGTAIFTDDVESGLNGWTQVLGSFAGTSGAGWIIEDGTFVYEQYYLAEWRNFNGFDRGLKYTYDTSYFNDGAWKVERVPYNAPGLLVWYRNMQYTVNHVTAPLFDLPSTGAKGTLLLVDSHFEPLRRAGEAADRDPTTLNNIPSRPQASNAAFSPRRTYRFSECLEDPVGSFELFCTSFPRQPGVRRFTDARGWYPGLELRGPDLVNDLFFRDVDASVVVPSRDNQMYSTRIVDPEGRALRDLYGVDPFEDGSIILGSGNPAAGLPPDGTNLSLGARFRVERVGRGARFAIVRVG